MHFIKNLPHHAKMAKRKQKWQKESKANLSKYTTASERCVRLAGWLAGLSAVLTSLQYLLRFASLRFASLCFASLRFASLCFASLRFASLCFASLRFASLRFALLCFALLCFACLLFIAHVSQLPKTKTKTKSKTKTKNKQ